MVNHSMEKDLFGKEISAGDVVAYFYNAKYGSEKGIKLGLVLSVKPEKLGVAILVQQQQEFPWISEKVCLTLEQLNNMLDNPMLGNYTVLKKCPFVKVELEELNQKIVDCIKSY